MSISFHSASLFTFLFHGEISDQNCPYIGTGLWDHQHSNHRNNIRPQHHRDIKAKTQYDCQPHPAESPIFALLCAAIEQHNHHESQQSEWNVAIDTPGKWSFSTDPLVLRHHTQSNPNTGHAEHCNSQSVLTLNLVPLPPHIVKKYIKNCHGNRGDPFSQSQRDGIILQPGCTQRQGTRNQMKGISRSQYHRHPTEQPKLSVSLTLLNHQHADGNDRKQIDHIKQSFYYCLHSLFSFTPNFILNFGIGQHRFAKVTSKQ